MSSERNGTGPEADLCVTRDGTSQALFLNIYAGDNDPGSHLKIMGWGWRRDETGLMRTLKSWWSPKGESIGDHYALPTTSKKAFEDLRRSSKSPVDSPMVPVAAEDGVHIQQRNEPTISALLLILLFFIISTVTVLSALWTLPLHTVMSGDKRYTLPTTVEDVSSLAWALKEYSGTSLTGLIHVLGVISLMSVWANAWSIPGSVILNILTGALIPSFFATLLQTTMTTIGSLVATVITATLAPIITRFFPSIGTITRIAFDGSSSMHSKSSPWARLAILRLLGIVPWSSVNIFAGLARPRVSLVQCTIGAFIGVMPWTMVTCQVGDILSSLAINPSTYLDTDDALTSATAMATQTISSILTSREALLKLLFLTLLSLAPVLAKDKIRAWLNGGTSTGLPLVRVKDMGASMYRRIMARKPRDNCLSSGRGASDLGGPAKI